MLKNKNIDHGKAFDWGRTYSNYAKYRDIYPYEFYQKIIAYGLCIENQNILDIGTGTGVLPRNLYSYGANFTGIDITENQILHAIELAEKEKMNIKFLCIPAEKCNFPAESFDIVTACQCFTYFHHEKLAPLLHKILKPKGKFAVLYMAWLPFDDKIAGKSEELILKFNPLWTGCGAKRHQISIPDIYNSYFNVVSHDVFDVLVPFTRDSWHGRIKTCRGVEASLFQQELEQFEIEHKKLMKDIAPENFKVLHYAAMAILQKK